MTSTTRTTDTQPNNRRYRWCSIDVIIPLAVTLVTVSVVALHVGAHHGGCPTHPAIKSSTEGSEHIIIDEGSSTGNSHGGINKEITHPAPSSSSSNSITKYIHSAWCTALHFFTVTGIQTLQTVSKGGDKDHTMSEGEGDSNSSSGVTGPANGGGEPPVTSSSVNPRNGKKSQLADRHEELLSAAYDRLLSPPDFPLAGQLCAEYFSSGRGQKEGGGGTPQPCGAGYLTTSSPLSPSSQKSASPTSWVVGYYQRALPTIGSSFTSATSLVKDTILHLDKYSLLEAPNNQKHEEKKRNNEDNNVDDSIDRNRADTATHFASLDYDISGMMTFIKELKEGSDDSSTTQSQQQMDTVLQQPTKPRHTAIVSFLQKRKAEAYNHSSQMLEAVFRALPPVRYRRRVRIVYRPADVSSSAAGGGVGVVHTKPTTNAMEVAYLPDYSDSRVSLTSTQLTDIGMSGLRGAHSNDARHLLSQIALYVDGEDCGADPTEAALSITTPVGHTVEGNCNSAKLIRIRKAVSNMADAHVKKTGGLRTMMIVTGEPRESAFRAIRSMLQQIVHTRSQSAIPTDIDIIYSLSSSIQTLVSDPIVADVFKIGGMAAVDSFLLRTLCPAVDASWDSSTSQSTSPAATPRVCIISEILDPFSKDNYAGREALLRWLLDFTLHRRKSSSQSSPTNDFLRRVGHMPHALGGLPHSIWALTALSARAMMYAFAEVRRLESHSDFRPVHHGSIVIKDGHGASTSSSRRPSDLALHSGDASTLPPPRKHLLRYDYFIITRVDSLFTLPLQDYSWLGSRVICYGDKSSSSSSSATSSPCKLHPPRGGTESSSPPPGSPKMVGVRTPIPYSKIFEDVPPRKYEREMGDLSTCVIPLGSPFGGYPDSHSICSRRGALVHANVVESTLQMSLPKLQAELAELSAGLNPEKFMLIKFELQDVNVVYGPAGSHFVSCGPTRGGWDKSPEMGPSCSRLPNVLCQCSMVTHSSFSATASHLHPKTSKIVGNINGGSTTADNIVKNLAGDGGGGGSPPAASNSETQDQQADGNTPPSSPPAAAVTPGTKPSPRRPSDSITAAPYLYYAIPSMVGSRWTQTGEFVSARNAHGMYFRFPPRRGYVSNQVQRSEQLLAMALLERRGLNTGYVNEAIGTGVTTCADFAAYVVDLHVASVTNRTRVKERAQQMPDTGDSAATADESTTSSPKANADWITTIQQDLETFKTRRKRSFGEFPVRNIAHTILVSQIPPTDTLFTLPDRLLQHYCALREGSGGRSLDRIQKDLHDALVEAAGSSGGKGGGRPTTPTLRYNEWGDFNPAGTSTKGVQQQHIVPHASLPLVDRNEHLHTNTTPHLGWQPFDSYTPVAALWGRIPSKKARAPIKVKRK